MNTTGASVIGTENVRALHEAKSELTRILTGEDEIKAPEDEAKLTNITKDPQREARASPKADQLSSLFDQLGGADHVQSMLNQLLK